LPSLEQHILRTLAYFDLFGYPLTMDELYAYLGTRTSRQDIAFTLHLMAEDELLFCIEDHYMLRNDASLLSRRKEDNQRALAMIKKARTIAGILYRFPFVKGVGISGSLSKQVAGPDADMDFFIITQRNRLWLARTLLHGLKKLSFLLGKQHWLCMNYFVDETDLQVPEKNIFTATEVVTLIPVCGTETLRSFYQANQWACDYFPNSTAITEKAITDSKPWYKKLAETIFAGKMGEMLNAWCMQLTAKRWTEKENRQARNCKGEPMSLLVEKYRARPNPANLQQKILKKFQLRCREAERVYIERETAAYFLRKEII
jgi:hypothetical protein